VVHSDLISRLYHRKINRFKSSCKSSDKELTHMGSMSPVPMNRGRGVGEGYASSLIHVYVYEVQNK
jgi:hypothetical protein